MENPEDLAVKVPRPNRPTQFGSGFNGLLAYKAHEGTHWLGPSPRMVQLAQCLA
jgi:hypothetical protein